MTWRCLLMLVAWCTVWCAYTPTLLLPCVAPNPHQVPYLIGNMNLTYAALVQLRLPNPATLYLSVILGNVTLNAGDSLCFYGTSGWEVEVSDPSWTVGACPNRSPYSLGLVRVASAPPLILTPESTFVLPLVWLTDGSSLSGSFEITAMAANGTALTEHLPVLIPWVSMGPPVVAVAHEPAVVVLTSPGYYPWMNTVTVSLVNVVNTPLQVSRSGAQISFSIITYDAEQNIIPWYGDYAECCMFNTTFGGQASVVKFTEWTPGTFRAELPAGTIWAPGEAGALVITMTELTYNGVQQFERFSFQYLLEGLIDPATPPTAAQPWFVQAYYTYAWFRGLIQTGYPTSCFNLSESGYSSNNTTLCIGDDPDGANTDSVMLG